MNSSFFTRMTCTLACVVFAVCGRTVVGQDAPAVKPLRLADLADAPDVTSGGVTESANVTAGQDVTTGLSDAETVSGEGSKTESSASADASESAVFGVAGSRWAARPLPGGERGTDAPPQAAQVDGEGAGDVLQVGGGLAGVLLLIWVLRTLIRKSAGSSATRGLLARVRAPEGVASIMARYPVARGEHVVLLEVGRRILVVHQASGSMTTLSELTDRDEVADMRARISGQEREKAEDAFAPALEASLDVDAQTPPLEPVEGMPGFVAETVDLTRRKHSSLTGGAA